MTDEILKSAVGALISGASSIVVALIGKARASAEKSGRTSGPVFQTPSHHSGAWRFLLCALIIWFLLSPFVFGWKIAGLNLFATIPITLIAAVVRPIRPASATAAVFLLYCVHFLLLIFWQTTEGTPREYPRNFALTAGFLAVNVICCWAVARSTSRRYRVNALVASTHRATPPRVAAGSGSGSVADEIAKLNDLRRSGVLTEDEFQIAKKRLLDS